MTTQIMIIYISPKHLTKVHDCLQINIYAHELTKSVQVEVWCFQNKDICV